MANLTCTQRLKVCHMRILRLDDDGTILSAADASYEYTAPVLFGYTPQTPERERIEQLNGCGDICGLYIGNPKAVDSAEISVTLCEQNAEIEELLLGGSTVVDGTGTDSIGYLSATDATVSEWGVAVEFWSIAWNGKQRALRNGSPAWYRHTFPKANFSKDAQATPNDAFAVVPLTGIAEVNSGFATGLAADPWPVSLGESVYGWFIDDAIPEGACGYVEVA